MSFCTNCGKQNAGVAKFCTACGNALVQTSNIQSRSIQQSAVVQEIQRTPEEIEAAKYRSAKQTRITIAILAFMAVLFAVYYFFLKHDPVRDGKKASSAYCDCGKEYNNAVVKVNEEFVNSFPSNNFKKRQDARNKLQELQNPVNAANLECANKAQIKYTKLRNLYINNIEQLTKFDASYNGNQTLCVPSDQSRLNTTYSLIESTIATIKDPEPDIARIKLDLIGKVIPGWSFQNLSQIGHATISNVSSNSNRIEYTIDLKLSDLTANNTSQHDAKIIMTYMQDANGWSYSNIKELFITFINVAPLNTWLQVTPLQNSSYTITSNGQRFWVQDGSYGAKYKGGGGDADVYYLRSNQIFLMSREDHPVELLFRYTPNF